MQQSITINSVNYDGERANIVFKPDIEDITINLGEQILPFLFRPYLLTPPRDVYGVYTIVVIVNGIECPNILNVPRPTPTPTPTPTLTSTPTPTSTSTPTPTPTITVNPCLLTPTPTLTTTLTQTPTLTSTPTPTITVNPCLVTPTSTSTPTQTPTLTNTPTLTSTSTPTPTLTPTLTTEPLNLTLFVDYAPGSIIASYTLVLNRLYNEEINVTFENILNVYSGSPITIFTGVTVSSGDLSGQTIVTIDENYNNYTGEPFFSQLSGTPAGSTWEIILIPPTPTPTPTLTNTPTQTSTPTVTPLYYYYNLLNCNLSFNSVGRSTEPLTGVTYNVDINTCYTIVGIDLGPSYDYDLDTATLVTDCTDVLCGLPTPTPTGTPTNTPTLTNTPTPTSTPSLICDTFTFNSINANTTINSAIKTSNGGWDASAYSVETYTTPVTLTFQTSTDGNYLMGGFSYNPTGNTETYTNITYGIYLQNNFIEIYENGGQVTVPGSMTTLSTDVWKVEYNGTNVTYYKNDVLIYTSSNPVTQPLHIFFPLLTQNEGVTNVCVIGTPSPTPTPTPTDTTSYLLQADGFYILQADGYKIIIT